MRAFGWLGDGPHALETARDGSLTLVRRQGAWVLLADDDSEQASPSLDAVWRTALGAAAAACASTRSRALVLGVALGSNLRLLHRRWPAARVVGVDWEPALFDLGRALGLHGAGAGDPRTTLVAGDAAVVVPALDGAFDLVLVDLFRGFDVAEAARSPALVLAVKARLVPGAVVLVNALHDPDALAAWTEHLGLPSIVPHVGNLVALYRA